MTVYVDNVIEAFGMNVCHMFAETAGEARAMAERAGVSRITGVRCHLDSTQLRAAVALGAVQVNWRIASAMLARLHCTGTLGPPEDALEWRKGWVEQHQVVHYSDEPEPPVVPSKPHRSAPARVAAKDW
jgi:hypothetical protein